MQPNSTQMLAHELVLVTIATERNNRTESPVSLVAPADNLRKDFESLDWILSVLGVYINSERTVSPSFQRYLAFPLS
jgi:hypothetical protein